MADLRSKFIEDYAGGLLNVSRQELSSTGEVLSQDGLLSDSTLFVEDGSGSKSGLKLGISLCEAVDPTTSQGVVNVRYADRTYASTRDLKIFSTAVASAQAALSDATATSITNLENAFQLLETAQDTLQNTFSSRQDIVDQQLEKMDAIDTLSADVGLLSVTTESLRTTLTAFVTQDQVIDSDRFYVTTGPKVSSSTVQFYKTRGANVNTNGSLRREDDIGSIEFAGNDGNGKIIGSSIVATAATAWSNDERATYLGFNWIGTEETSSSQSITEWISFGKPANATDEIGPKTITFASVPTTDTASTVRPNVQINNGGQLIKCGSPALTVKELKAIFNGLDTTDATAALNTLKTLVAGLAD